MKTFQQFQENIIAKKLGKLTLGQIAKGGAALYGGKKVLDFFSDKTKNKSDTPTKTKYKTYENPGDGSIPGRYKDESLKDYNIRRNKGLQDAIDKS
tara:strand:- start:74 stop:361 length:288 start_codon:yes stop_codon:yes gene_type:complete